MSQPSRSKHFKRRLIAGVIVIAPLTATLWVLWWIFQLLDGLLGRFLYPALERYVHPVIGLLPGLGLLVLLLLLLAIGWLAERTVGSRVLGAWHQFLERLPVTRRVYGAANRIVRTVLSADSRPFNEVVLVEYPSEGRWSIGFLSARAPEMVQRHVDDAVSVFVPTTPNPTSGFVVIVSRSKTVPLPMTVDQAFTYILSAGSVVPDAGPGPIVVPGPDWRPGGGERDSGAAAEHAPAAR
jgi:uncharacterized membrane protein